MCQRAGQLNSGFPNSGALLKPGFVSGFEKRRESVLRTRDLFDSTADPVVVGGEVVDP